MKKLLVFDLDGTLWSVNSHVDIVESYQKKYFFSSVIGKMLYKIVPGFYMKQLTKGLEQVPEYYIKEYLPSLCDEPVRLLKSNISDSIIITNAPERIAKRANEIFKVPVFCAPIGEKSLVLKSYAKEWERLIVITDNITDIDLLSIADEAIVYVDKNKQEPFSKLSLNCVLKIKEK